MADTRPRDSMLTTVCIVAALVMMAYYLIGRHQERVARQKHVPGLAAEIGGAKSLCEQNIRGIPRLNDDLRRRPPNLARGQDLYADAAAEYDICVYHLRSAIDAGFTDDHGGSCRKMLDKAVEKRDAFIAWTRSTKDLPPMREQSSTADLAEWMKLFTDLDNEDKERLKAELERCRFLPWERLAARDHAEAIAR